MTAAHVGGHGQGFPCSLLSGALSSHGVSTVDHVSDRGCVSEMYDDRPFIVLPETKFSIHCIPVWDRYSPLLTRVERTYILFVVWEKQKKNLFFLKKKVYMSWQSLCLVHFVS